MDEIQNDIPDLINDIRAMLSDLECAESCDNAEDLRDNLRHARMRAAVIMKDLNALNKQAAKL